ncbi:MAG: L,D-transpeptidase [Polyangiaceae bacterium]|nr:L,D-transpeptidase [Polyangiaceae bacterium]
MRRSLLLCALVGACAAPAGPVSVPAPGPDREAEAAPPEPRPLVAEAELAAPAASAPVPVSSAAPPDTRPRIGSVRDITWIHAKPDASSRKIGQVRVGASVVTKGRPAVPTPSCPAGFVEVEPDGYVCANTTTTRDLDGELFRALSLPAPRDDAPLPYRYALSNGAPMYTKIPSREEQLKVEGPEDRRPNPGRLRWATGHEELASDEPGGVAADSQVPDVFAGGKKAPVPWGRELRLVKKWIPHGSMLAFTRAFEADGRVWLLSTDLSIVPADRVRPFRVSTFRGTPLGADVALPIAWARHDPARRWVRRDGVFEAAGAPLPPRSFAALSGGKITLGERVFVATREPGVYLDAADVAIVERRETLPVGVEAGERWIDVHLRAGTLVAYEGERPVFATLVSPGAGGVGPYRASDAELVRLSTTPLGLYRVGWKTRAAPMTPEGADPKKFWIADVPDTQYFRGPFAIHTAYWHEDFGMPKSAGCINVSPADGRYLFGFTGPRVPDGWQGATPSAATGRGTTIAVSP